MADSFQGKPVHRMVSMATSATFLGDILECVSEKPHLSIIVISLPGGWLFYKFVSGIALTPRWKTTPMMDLIVI